MKAQFAITQGDRLPDLAATLRYSDGTAIDLSGATIAFFMEKEDGTVVALGGTASLVDGPTGRVKYEWGSADTGAEGRYFGEFRPTLAGKDMTVPNDSYIEINIKAKLG